MLSLLTSLVDASHCVKESILNVTDTFFSSAEYKTILEEASQRYKNPISLIPLWKLSRSKALAVTISDYLHKRSANKTLSPYDFDVVYENFVRQPCGKLKNLNKILKECYTYERRYTITPKTWKTARRICKSQEVVGASSKVYADFHKLEKEGLTWPKLMQDLTKIISQVY